MSVSQCAILVGGRGTRLGELTATTPKPLLHVGQRVFLDYLIAEIARHGFDDILCLAGYRAGEVQSWARNHPSGLKIKVIAEPHPRGTAGALSAVKDLLHDEFLVLNGDFFFDINLVDLAAWRPTGEWQGVIALHAMTNAERYGTVEIRGSTICGFSERGIAHGPALINGGIYRLKREMLDLVKSIPCSIERDVFPVMAEQGLLRGRIYDGFFLDVGVPSALESAQSLVPAAVRRPALILDRDGVVHEDVDYAHRPDQIKWTDGIFDVVKEANDKGLYVFIVTNQAGVARGKYDEKAVIDLHAWMNSQFRMRGAHIDEFKYCPHHPTAGRAPYQRVCSCRKPAPGMILDLARRWPIDLSRSLLVGDKESDLEAARNAGITGVLYRSEPISSLLRKWLDGATRRSFADEPRAASSC